MRVADPYSFCEFFHILLYTNELLPAPLDQDCVCLQIMLRLDVSYLLRAEGTAVVEAMA
jgi:hypothetical protein